VSDPWQLIAIDRAGGRLAGIASVSQDHRIGGRLAVPFRGQGLGRERQRKHRLLVPAERGAGAAARPAIQRERSACSVSGEFFDHRRQRVQVVDEERADAEALAQVHELAREVCDTADERMR
jgi:hypothetical protein